MGKFRTLLKKDWLKYGFETFAVLVGVLGAFALENWRDNLKDRQTEKEYIQNLISDINRQISIIDEQADLEVSMRSTCEDLILAHNNDHDALFKIEKRASCL